MSFYLSWISEAHPVVPAWVTLLFVSILAAMILCLALEEKLHAKKSVIAGLFAILCLLLGAVFGLLPFGPISVGGHEINLPVYQRSTGGLSRSFSARVSLSTSPRARGFLPGSRFG